jgi:radical SAM superfamily enzyme YgiQ (UPF0313 family)
MRITIISPPFGEKGTKSDNLQMAPPILEYLASMTLQLRPDAQIALIDANREDFDADSMDSDIVAFSTLTPQAPWVYRTADTLRERGKKVVIGGMHVTALPEEGKLHADAIVVGEAESVWRRVLEDAERGGLAPFYYGERLPLNGIPKRVRGYLKHDYRFDSFFTTRGCPYHCTFCSVRRFFGDTVRYRPINDVVEEVSSSPKRMLMNIDDNIWGLNIERSIELFKETADNVKGKYWFGQGDLMTVQRKKGDELLEWANRSGLTTVMVGWESSNPASLEEYDAKTKQGRDRAEAIKRVREYGIDVMLFIMVGGRRDAMADYEGVLDLCDRLDVSAHPVMLTPFPGTELYEEYKKYMLDGHNWDDFDGNTALFEHGDPAMTPENREQATLWLRERLFTWPRIMRRIWKISRKGFPMAHLNSLMLQWAHRRAFREYAAEHRNPEFDIKKMLATNRHE